MRKPTDPATVGGEGGAWWPRCPLCEAFFGQFSDRVEAAAVVDQHLAEVH
jgi:hypothetical protein